MFNSYVKLPEGIMIIVPWFIPPVHIGSMKHTTQCWLNPINFDSENTDENHVFFLIYHGKLGVFPDRPIEIGVPLRDQLVNMNKTSFMMNKFDVSILNGIWKPIHNWGEHHVLWSYSYVPSPVGSHFEPHLPNVEPQ